MQLNVLSDFHHAGLLRSLIMLFEDRFGGNLYRPIRREWYEQGYWKVYDHPATVAQYLDIGGATPDGSKSVNIHSSTGDTFERNLNDHIYYAQDIAASGKWNKAITLDGFFDMKFDIVIASIPAHVKPFRELCDKHPNHPKLIYQIGNAWNVDVEQANMIDGILASALVSNKFHKCPMVTYHQEFDLGIFYKSYIRPGNVISSFVNCFNTDRLFEFDWRLFQEVERAMPDWTFRAFGGGCRDGNAPGDEGVASAMRESMFVWHTKAGGDGYGHVVHNIPAVGRPMITRKSYYVGKMAEPLMVDGVTCIAIDGLNPNQIVEKILHYSQPEPYTKMCRAAYSNFVNLVDFDKEADQIADMLKKVV